MDPATHLEPQEGRTDTPEANGSQDAAEVGSDSPSSFEGEAHVVQTIEIEDGGDVDGQQKSARRFFRNQGRMPGEKLTTSMRRAGRRISMVRVWYGTEETTPTMIASVFVAGCSFGYAANWTAASTHTAEELNASAHSTGRSRGA